MLAQVNEGVPGKGNGDGQSYIALSISCDGFHWSPLTILLWSTGRQGEWPITR
jgi:hypothetical protein